jgi:hypothetical protein
VRETRKKRESVLAVAVQYRFIYTVGAKSIGTPREPYGKR